MTSTRLLRLRAIALALRGDGPVDSTLSVAGLRKVRFHVWSSVGRFPSAAVDSKRVLHRDLFPYVRRKLIQQKRILLRARQRRGRGRVEMLIAADDEAIGKIGIELEPLGLELAVDNWRILAWETRIELDFHVQIGMRLKQPARKLGSTISDIVRACVRPDDLGAPVVRKQPFECCDVPVKLP